MADYSLSYRYEGMRGENPPVHFKAEPEGILEAALKWIAVYENFGTINQFEVFALGMFDEYKRNPETQKWEKLKKTKRR